MRMLCHESPTSETTAWDRRVVMEKTKEKFRKTGVAPAF
jgi:hypothetical protein